MGNSWAEQLGHGNIDEALTVQVFRGPLEQPDRLHPHYEAALMLAAAWIDDETGTRLQQVVLFESDDVWSAEIQRQRGLLTRLRREEEVRSSGPAWRPFADGEAWIVDGLVRCLGNLETSLTWAGLVLGLSPDTRDHPNVWIDRLGGAPRTDEDVLASWVGKILGWRLSRRDGRARDRLAEATQLTAQFERYLVQYQRMVSPWPHGFADMVDRTLDHWEVMAGQLVTMA